ncbi:hypothetical protein P153DRAFT_193532 [Dothidotthia symphoricarpi CBS 119687]|uniref:Uncharacterized protein n=1 Tax=Dothidotthia symphoricarpi CBS 119687 TaxID=1392245 RepID=A0A6A6ALL8_9PLEO|nr:uncharacterized protein P153DRAFT_193532 [Dothidotthia symphoricarpi CBS 119687]KAF2131361.1 hypothetical protein P153DRAFT_193532 [Dothidotthia symphoricarpi CBS 119687]
MVRKNQNLFPSMLRLHGRFIPHTRLNQPIHQLIYSFLCTHTHTHPTRPDSTQPLPMTSPLINHPPEQHACITTTFRRRKTRNHIHLSIHPCTTTTTTTLTRAF